MTVLLIGTMLWERNQRYLDKARFNLVVASAFLADVIILKLVLALNLG